MERRLERCKWLYREGILAVDGLRIDSRQRWLSLEQPGRNISFSSQGEKTHMKKWMIALVVACVLLVSTGATSFASDAPPTFNPPQHYYLALGDSLAFGYP